LDVFVSDMTRTGLHNEMFVMQMKMNRFQLSFVVFYHVCASLCFSFCWWKYLKSFSSLSLLFWRKFTFYHCHFAIIITSI